MNLRLEACLNVELLFDIVLAKGWGSAPYAIVNIKICGNLALVLELSLKNRICLSLESSTLTFRAQLPRGWAI